jgi:SPP1 family predicted phage head-tail adaptor
MDVLLDKRVGVQKPGTTKDAAGQVSNWVDVFATADKKVWANVRPVGGGEKLRAMATGAEISHFVTVRYSAAYADPVAVATWRVLLGARIFNVTAARDIDEAHDRVVLDCTEGTLDGR